jgi:flagellar motility protein MotE (MotC chaperone)
MRRLTILTILSLVSTASLAEPELKASEPKQGPACLTDPLVLKDIEDKKAALEDKEQYLAEREAELEQREKAITEKLNELRAVRDEIAGIQGEKKEKRGERISKLVETFEKMSPTAAAGLIARLDERLAVDTLEQIQSPRLAKILGKMPAEKSSALTQYLVNRKMPRRKPAEGSGS